uniref:Uncharacterized protein n=1 Tax=Kalanchoe fedtschenkoi TaxID=63787 RepID=A0A7N0R9C3_KALFE
MARQISIKEVQRWFEVAPSATLRSHLQKTSRVPVLETIEEAENKEEETD